MPVDVNFLAGRRKKRVTTRHTTPGTRSMRRPKRRRQASARSTLQLPLRIYSPPLPRFQNLSNAGTANLLTSMPCQRRERAEAAAAAAGNGGDRRHPVLKRLLLHRCCSVPAWICSGCPAGLGSGRLSQGRASVILNLKAKLPAEVQS